MCCRAMERNGKQGGCDAVVDLYIVFVLDRTNLMMFVALVRVRTPLTRIADLFRASHYGYCRAGLSLFVC